MAGAETLKRDIRNLVHEVVDDQFAKIDTQIATVSSQLEEIRKRLSMAAPAAPGNSEETPKP